MNHFTCFGLREDPFRITPDRGFYFPSRNHTAVREVIRYGLEQGEGFLIITGEIGSGKTLLLRLMMDDLPQDRFETALLLSPHLSRHELLLAILQDIGLTQPEGSNSSLDALLRILNDRLYSLAQQGKRLLVVIDEAQNLPDESLEQLRLLSNFETDSHKLLQVVLFGQPELRAKLAQPSLRQLTQRVTIMETLHPLNKQEMTDYIRFRCGRAGQHEFKLPRRVITLLWRHTQGYPRLINKLMSRSILVACAEGKKVLTPAVVKEAVASFNTPAAKPFLRRGWFWGGVAGTALLLALAFLWFNAPRLPEWLRLLPARSATTATMTGNNKER
ncbi:MAG: ExeA family protein [Thermodesulfobacteriota bacterium]